MTIPEEFQKQEQEDETGFHGNKKNSCVVLLMKSKRKNIYRTICQLKRASLSLGKATHICRKVTAFSFKSKSCVITCTTTVIHVTGVDSQRQGSGGSADSYWHPYHLADLSTSTARLNKIDLRFRFDVNRNYFLKN